MDNDLKRDKVKEDIYTYLKQGMYKKDAAVMAGVDESTLFRWIKEDASFASRVAPIFAAPSGLPRAKA